MTREEVESHGLSIIADVVKIRQSATKNYVIPHILREVKAVPDYYPEYREEVAQYVAGKLHRDGEFPDELFNRLKPFQPTEEFEYMKACYQPITKDVVFEFGNTVKKALINGNIEFPATDGANSEVPLKTYLENQIDNFNSFMLWAESMVDTKIIDGNALIVVWPTFETDGDGRIMGEVTAQPLLYAVPAVVYRMYDGKDWHYLVERSEKSYVDVGGKKQKKGYIYRYIGPEYYAEFAQFGPESDNTFETKVLFEHGIGFTPATRTKGIAKIQESHVYYSSIVSLALPHLNNAVVDQTGLAAVKAKIMFPTRILIDEPCDYHEGPIHCDGGKLTYFDAETDKTTIRTCPSCNGLGWKRNVSISSEIRINPNNSRIDEQGTQVLNANDVMAYVSPETTSAEFLRKEVSAAIAAAEHKLHLKAEPRQAGAITATEKNRDKENTEAFIKPISNQIWDAISFTIEAMGILMYGANRYETMKPTIYYPDSFDIVTTEDVVEMMGEAQAKKLPSIMKQGVMQQYLTKDAESNPKEAAKLQLIFMADRLIAMTPDEAALQLSRGVAAPWEVYLNTNPGYVIDLVAAENPRLYEDMQAAVLAVQAKAKELTPTDNALPAPIEP